MEIQSFSVLKREVIILPFVLLFSVENHAISTWRKLVPSLTERQQGRRDDPNSQRRREERALIALSIKLIAREIEFNFSSSIPNSIFIRGKSERRRKTYLITSS